MSTGEQRAAWLIQGADQLADPPARADLEMWGHLNLRLKGVAEHILWRDRTRLLACFDLLSQYLEGPPEPVAAPEPPRTAEPMPDQADEVPEEAESPVVTVETPVRDEQTQRFAALMKWRDQHLDKQVHAISDQDLARLLASGALAPEEVLQAAPRLLAHATVVRFAAEISAALGWEPPIVEEAVAPAEEPAVVVEPSEPDLFAPFRWEQVAQFASYWSEELPKALGAVSLQAQDGTVTLGWMPMPQSNGVTLYRIVYSLSGPPIGSPDLGTSIGVTQATSGSFEFAPVGSVTYFAVWANQGPNLMAATQAQPVLIGYETIIWPPQELTVQVTSRRAIAALFTVPADSEVEVQRFPKGVPARHDQSRALNAAQVKRSGFRDDDPPLGEDIIYAVFSCAQVVVDEKGTTRRMYSKPALAPVHVVPDPEQIQVQVTQSRSGHGYDIAWVPPASGRVVLFALPERVEAGLENVPRTREIIEGKGLTSRYRITDPPEDLGGLKMIQDYAVDPSWVRAHFVAVHWVSDESLWVGPAATVVSPTTPEHVNLVERVDAQIITFAWPEGVSLVQAYQGPSGQMVDPAGSEPIAQLTHQEYVRMGGMRITTSLPSNGCSVHLYGVVFLGGNPTYSAPATVQYPGITRLKYQVFPVGPDGNPIDPSQRPHGYRVFAEVDDDLHAMPLILVAQRGRLPLHPQDGRTVLQQNASLQAGVQQQLGVFALGEVQVFVRLFVDLPPADCGSVAVLDPSLSSLRVYV